MTASGATTIARARVTGVQSADRALVTQLAVAGMLAGADLRPPRLPPAAVLIVNRLVLPANRRLPVRPGGRLDPAWERAARDAMADLYQRSVRPMDDIPPPGCPAVLFWDEAELLACLLLDISRGRAAGRWWWHAYAKRWGSLTPVILAPLMADLPRSVPAALRILAERGAAASVVQRLSPDEARSLLRAICDAFDAPLPDLAKSRFTSRQSPPVFASTLGQRGELLGDAPPWLEVVPSGVRFTDLTSESACLLGVALTLAHSPSIAQSVAFTQTVERWWQAETLAHRPSAGPEQPAVAQLAHTEPGAEALAAASQPPFDAPDPFTATETGAVRRLAEQAGSESPTSTGLPTSAELATFLKVANSDASTVRDDLPVTSLPVDDNPDTARIVEPAEWLNGIATELGGVLFLINLMQRLDLPGCFEKDWQLASQVGPWGTLELLARGLLSVELPTFPKVGNSDLRADPLWSALAALDGRRVGELPDGAVTCPVNLRVPATWLHWLDPAYVIVRPGEATSAPACGASVPRQPSEIASHSLAMTVEATAPLEGPLLAGVSRDLRVWLAGVTSLLHAMLPRALGEDFDPVTDLLLRHGQLYVTSSHVDLVMPLGSVAMPVRIAGLDFDPGWLPAFGRVVQFHYE